MKTGFGGESLTTKDMVKGVSEASRVDADIRWGPDLGKRMKMEVVAEVLMVEDRGGPTERKEGVEGSTDTN